MTQWFDNETFWIELFAYLFPEERFRAAEEAIDQIFALTRFQQGTVLDLCCGPGRFAIPMAKRGNRVTGVDKTPFLLNKAQERATAEGVEIEWVLDDMLTFVRPNAFDLIVNMFTSFGYFDDKQDDITVLQNICQSLKPGGVCIMEMMGKEILARIYHPTTSEELPDGTLIVQRHEIFDEWSRIRNEWLLIKADKAASFKFHHTLYSGQELKERLLQVGFAQVKLFGNLEGEEYGLNAHRLVAVGWKAA